MMALLKILSAAVLLILVKIVTTFIRNKNFKAFAEQSGCKEPNDVTGPFPWGFTRLKRILYNSHHTACWTTLTRMQGV